MMEESTYQDEFIESAKIFIRDQLDLNGDVDAMIETVAANENIKQILKTIKAMEEIKRKQQNPSQ